MQQEMMAGEPPKMANKRRQTETAFDPVSAALQQLHHAVASEALPDDFLKILEQIDARIAAAADQPLR